MRKYFFLTASAALLLGYGSVSAETKTPYLVNFDSEINTKVHDFKVDTGWRHVVDSYKSYYTTYYVDYGYRADEGVDGSGCLYVGSQTLGDYDTKVRDLLVTPMTKGIVSIAVKLSNSYSGAVKFYKIEKVNGKFQPVEEIEPSNMPELSTTEFKQVTISTNSDSYIGIWGNNVLLDNFVAQTADIELAHSMKIANVKLLSSSKPDCDAEGKFPVKMGVSVVNDGEATLTPGEDNYSLSLLFAANNDSIVTTPINQELAVGDTAFVELAASADFATYKGYKRYDVKENMNGTIATGTYVDPIAYAPKMVLYKDDSKMYDGDELVFGMVKADSTMTFTLTNEGAKELKITSVTMPDGFTTSLQAPLTLPAHSDPQTFTVTLSAAQTGVKDGEMIIKADESEDYTLKLSGTVLDPTKFFADFENGKKPAGMLFDSKLWEVKKWKGKGNGYVLSAKNKDASKAILPLLELAEGEKLTFSAGKRSFSSYVNVYYSPDRLHWTLVKEIAASDMPSTYESGSYDFKLGSFVVDGIPAGKQYIAFESGQANIDNIYGGVVQSVAHDLSLADVTLPTLATVNNRYVAKVTVSNVNTKEEDDYKVTLYVDGVAVDSAKTETIAVDSSLNVTLGYMPHKAGVHTAYVLLTAGDLTISTDTVSVTVGDEVASADVTVGEATGYIKNSPLNTYYNRSESEVIYTAAQLNLKEGQKITGLTLKGYNEAKDIPTQLSVWLENTDDEAFATPYAERDKALLTSVYDAAYTFKKSGSADAPVDVLSIGFAAPFEYTGKNLRVVVRSVSSVYGSVYFQQNGSEDTHAIVRWNDTDLSNATYNNKPQPVVTFAVAQDPLTVSGTVTDNFNLPVADALVKLTSGDVIYEGNTDEKGQYTVPVIQTDKTYQATVGAEGYEDVEMDSVSLAEGSIVKDVALTVKDREFTVGTPDFICLPVNLSEAEAAEAGEFYELTETTVDESHVLTLTMTQTKEVKAGVPCLFVAKVAQPFTNMATMELMAQPDTVRAQQATLAGTYRPCTALKSDVASIYSVGGSKNEVTATAHDSLRLAAYDALLSADGNESTIVVKLVDPIVSGIGSAKAADNAEETVYNMNGQKLEGGRLLRKGLYIINGKKVIIR